MPLSAARARLECAARPLESETVPVHLSAGRTPALDLLAPGPVPSEPASRWPGVALPAKGRGPFELWGELRPGERFEGGLDARHAVRVGALQPLPSGAQRVAREDQITTDGDQVSLREDLAVGYGVEAPGSLADADQVLVKAQAAIGWGDVERLAALGFRHVKVRRRPRIALSSDAHPAARAVVQRWLERAGTQVVVDPMASELGLRSYDEDLRVHLGSGWEGAERPDGLDGPAPGADTWFRLTSQPPVLGLSDRLFEAWVGLNWIGFGLWRAWGLAVPQWPRRRVRLAETLQGSGTVLPLKVADGSDALPLAWALPLETPHLMARADAAIELGSGQAQRGAAIDVLWLKDASFGV